MRIAGFGRSEVPFHMFDMAREAEEARRAAKLKNLYHRGQDLAWDGRKVLADLIAKHGGIHIDPERKDAIARIFAIILWGELAAWKISAQLADRLEPLEAKMAATSQVHDEARHFYVMYDYLSALGPVPRTLDRPARAVLDMVLTTDSLIEKLTGMQLLVETLALTIFQLVRESNIEPVLCELLRYYEKDEARHVGLGLQHLPDMMRRASRVENARAIWFQLKIAAWTLRGLQLLEQDFARLDISARRVIEIGRNKTFTATELLWEGMGFDRPPPSRQRIEAGLDAVVEMMFPRPETGPALIPRLRAARQVWRAGGLAVERVDLGGGPAS